jgi:hypothetical protein
MDAVLLVMTTNSSDPQEVKFIAVNLVRIPNCRSVHCQ